jgi:hypothetical protein
MGCNYMPTNTPLMDTDKIIHENIELKQRLKDAEKWMRHLDGCALGSRIAYNSITKSFCTCGLIEFLKGEVRG